jgi:predicted site-specific integrase-resolvase
MAIQHINQQTLAERWQVSETTLERWRSIGVGPVFLKLHGRIVYREQDLEAYEEQCLRQSTAQRSTSSATQQSPSQASSFA